MEVKVEVTAIEENYVEIKELLRDLKKSESSSEGGESFVNEEARKEERSMQGEKSKDEEEPQTRESVKRVKLPIFVGLDSHGLLTRVQKFSEVQNVAEKERFNFAFISMEGNASHWFKFQRQNSKNLSWSEFSRALIRKFRGKERNSLYERLARLKQQGSGRLCAGV